MVRAAVGSKPVDGEADDRPRDFGRGRAHRAFLSGDGLGHGSQDLEVGFLPEALLLEEDGAPPHVAKAEIHRHHQPILAHVGLGIERDGLDVVTDHFPIEDGVRVLRFDHAEPTVGGVGLHDGAGEEVLDRGLASLVREDRHRHGLDVVREVPAERIAAAREGDGEQGEAECPRAAGVCHARVTMLTRRFGTTTTFSTRRRSTHGFTRSSPRASWRTRSSAASTSTSRRPRTLPSTCTTTVTSVFWSAAGSATGQRCLKRLSRCPSCDQSSSVTCGQKGPSKSRVVSTASRMRAARSATVAPSPEAASKAWSALKSSMIAAIAVLEWNSRSMSSVTRRMVSWIVRRNVCSVVGTVAALERSGGALGGGASPPPSSDKCAITKRQTRLRNREAPSMPWSFHSRSFSGGAAKSSKRRPVSAPYFSRTKSSDTTLPFDFDIIAPSLMTMPWLSSAMNGSSIFVRPRSRSTFVLNRAYRRWSTACSM